MSQAAAPLKLSSAVSVLASRRKTTGLRHKLMQLALTLTAIGLTLLVISLGTVQWLRTNMNHLAFQRTPAMIAIQHVQIGLQRTLAGLRGWVSLGDEQFRTERRAAWTEQIEPAFIDIQLVSQTWSDPADHSRLETLSELLVELRESQWWVEDVAQTEGNQPASHILRQRVEPVATALRKVINALITDADTQLSMQTMRCTVGILQTLAGFRQAFLTAEDALARFVAQGEGRWERAGLRALSDAEMALDGMAQWSATFTASQQDQIAYIRQEFPWYKQFAQEVLAARQSARWNVALYRMRTETIPLTVQTTQLLDTLATNQAGLMQRDTQFIAFAGTSAMVLSCLLIILMAAVAYTLASSRANQITQPLTRLSLATEELAAGILQTDLPVMGEDELGSLTNAFNRMRVRLQDSEAALRQTNTHLHDANQDLERYNHFIRETFGRYLTDDVVSSLLDTPEGLQLGGENRQVTILMSDLRGFTSLSGRLAAEQVVAILNRYLGSMAEVITHYQGTIDEFIGDAILVIFGAPVWRADHAQRAVACAVQMQLAMTEVNKKNRHDGLPSIEMGIGVNTGEVVVGNIGSDKRAKYGVVGSPVNLTARIESYTIGGQILIADTTRRAVGPILQIAEQLEINAKGVDTPLSIFEVRGIGEPYQLFLSQSEEEFIPLSETIPLQYAVLDGKYLDGTVFTGQLVTLSATGGEVSSEHLVAPRSNIKIQLTTSKETGSLGELYAKVIRQLSDNRTGFAVHFTSVPPELGTLFEGLRASKPLRGT